MRAQVSPLALRPLEADPNVAYPLERSVDQLVRELDHCTKQLAEHLAAELLAPAAEGQTWRQDLEDRRSMLHLHVGLADRARMELRDEIRRAVAVTSGPFSRARDMLGRDRTSARYDSLSLG